MNNILICDDEKDIVNALEIYLNLQEYKIFKAYNGQEAVNIVKENDIQLCLLDVMMPIKDGIKAMQEIREFSNVPIILLTAKSEDNDKILGLNSGADDYVVKPFNPVEVLARVKSQLRRYTHLGANIKQDNIIRIGSVSLNDATKAVTVDDENIKLTPTEYDILKLLMQNKGKVYSPKEIYINIWEDSPIGVQNTIAVHIRHLREKIEINPTQPRYIKVIWGQGYKFDDSLVDERKKNEKNT